MPASKLLDCTSGSTVSIRVRRYINKHWQGNILQAATALGCTYGPLRSVALGHTGPSLDVLAALSKHSGDPIERWMR